MAGIYSEHLKYGNKDYWPLLAQCVTSFLVHGYLPDTLMYVLCVPIIKHRSDKINNKDNYRTITIVSKMSDLLEILLLERLYSIFVNFQSSIWF